MRTLTRNTTVAAVTTALALGLTACGTASDPGAAGGGSDAGRPLVVAATPTPHGDILRHVQKNLAAEAGLDLEIREFTDYVLPNTATESGQVDANYFQHRPYLEEFNEKQGTHLVPVAPVHLEPLGLYSKKLDRVGELSAGQTVAVPNDTTNEARALKLLAHHDLIELASDAGETATLADITDRKGLKFKELQAATLPRSLDDVDAAVINGNYALETGLKPAKDALALEKAEGNPYTNLLVVGEGDEDDPRVKKLARLLQSEKVQKYIEDTYEGSVVPAPAAERS